MFKAVKKKSRLLMGMVNAEADLNEAKFIYYYGPTHGDSSIYSLNDYSSLLENSNFDKSKNTVLYLHGYLEDPSVESIHVIVDAYMQRDDINLIILDWSELADGNYMFDAVGNAKQLGPIMADVLLKMFESGLEINTFHIVGHSLGGQMAGIIGREIYRLTNKTKQIKRITALDPAFPLFYMGKLASHLNRKDAEFVDVIHTDAWLYGAPVSTGTADFWPNSGKTLQPGCPKRNYKMLTDNVLSISDLSSHRRSWWFWAESVTGKFTDNFEAVKAKNWNDFKNGKVLSSSHNIVVMGHDCPTNICGDYFLQTNGITPFARGKAGTIYVEPKELIGYKYVNPDMNDGLEK
ncbi:pancreatic lipase-related protein 3 isoform X3 [Teleopsis dalmanni]|nr:pancreatic lipase-related protein 3 isoform X3 [Teleopsis dalmanni]